LGFFQPCHHFISLSNMSHHQNDELDMVRGATHLRFLPAVSNTASVEDDDVPPDADEPPDERQPMESKGHIKLPWVIPNDGFNKHTPPRSDRKRSLLTQGLTTTSSPTNINEDSNTPSTADLTRGLSTASNYSNASASTADLTSDGHTSPDRANSPSPPLPPANFRGLGISAEMDRVRIVGKDGAPHEAMPVTESTTALEPVVEAGLGRKRCIRFACGRTPIRADSKTEETTSPELKPVLEPEEKTKRQSCLRFVCPPKIVNETDGTAKRLPLSRSPAPIARARDPATIARLHRDSEATLTDVNAAKGLEAQTDLSEHPIVETQKHESSSSRSADEQENDWDQEPVYHGKKLTLHDFLEKEDKFRRLGEEAEEEALQDEEDLDDEEANDDDDDEEEEDNDGNDDSDQSDADDGNETDDEEGFAASDGESEAGSEYMFWTLARDSSAVSNDFIEPIRPTVPRAASVSSIDSSHVTPMRDLDVGPAKQAPKRTRPRKIRPGTPELPDSTDFVCGTLDEDRPLEAAYLSCMEERRRSKHIIVPQDIDPSFPTSDPEDKDEDDNEDEDNEHLLLHGNLDEDDISPGHDDGKRGRRGLRSKPSPKLSPAPVHRNQLHHSPPPRKAQGQSPRRLRSPPPRRRLKSPPQQRRPSTTSSPKSQALGINYASLSSRPGLTHTTSLPRSPAPIIRNIRPSAGVLHHASQAALATSGDTVIAPTHNRGAIDIVKGLEKKRQRRREKLAQKCHHRAAKEKARKPLPGKGAERMKEVGEQKAGRGRHNVLATKDPKYVLSI
jgi:hypothetical protein